MFSSEEDQKLYIKENYPEITDSRIDDNHWDLFCSECKIVRGFQVISRGYTTNETEYSQIVSTDFNAPMTMFFRCPVCKTYKMWLLFRLSEIEKGEDGKDYRVRRYYRITTIPGEGLEEIEELPKEPISLRVAYRQAIRSMDANAHIAAALMFRRALQIITRDILKVTPGKLANELKSAVGIKYNGVTITNDFSDIGYIVKEAGNQGAHPDKDPDLLNFTQEDAEDLQKIFLEIVSDLFIAPEAIKKAKEDFIQRRKINPPSY